MKKVFCISIVLLIGYNYLFSIEVIPYLKSPTPTSIYVCQETSVDSGSVVNYGLTSSLDSTLVDEYQVAGHHQINWDASRLSPGLYFYKIETGTLPIQKKPF